MPIDNVCSGKCMLESQDVWAPVKLGWGTTSLPEQRDYLKNPSHKLS